MTRRRRVVFRPFSLIYFALLGILFTLTFIAATSSLRDLLVRGVGLPPEAFGFILVVSLVGSTVNIPFTTVESKVPVVTHREVKFFFVKWRIPRVVTGVRRTLVTINLGGAVVPVLISIYLLLWSIPTSSPNIISTYTRTLVVLLVVAVLTHRNSRLVPGLGIATPAFGPPLTTAIIVFLVNWVSPLSCPTQVAYIGGTLGTLIGADLMNLGNLPELGAPVVSIGGAGTFDGIYITGLVSVFLVMLVI
ncbi:MAG: DUF1614 domain-containing protein [Candidatus Bathyarchaeota archaeon]